MKHIALLASGNGSNAQAIMQHFAGSESVHVCVLITNKRNAGVVAHASNFGVKVAYLTNAQFAAGSEVLECLEDHAADYVILAGFLRKIHSVIVEAYPQRIVNIHPALLPKFGGKGMYGKYVHQAVKDANEKESGITIHYVSEAYDEGQVIEQQSVAILPDDSTSTIEKKVRALELEHYSLVIEQLLASKNNDRS